jgi:transglutaminase-like putative cysteine protease
MTGRTRLTIVAGFAVLLAAVPLASLMMTQEWLLPACIAIGLIAGTGWVLRRQPVPRLAIAVAQLMVLALWLGVLVASDVAWFGIIPNAEWVSRIADVTAAGVEAVSRYAVPVPVEQGMMLLLVGGVGIVAVFVDTIAVSFNRVPWAGPVLAVNYAIAAFVLGGSISWFWFALPALGFMMLLAAEGRTRVAMWGRSATPSASHTSIPQTSSLARSGRRTGAVALCVAIAIPAAIPALSDGMLDGRWGGGGSGGSGRTIEFRDPVVNLQENLNLPEDVPVLRYITDSDRREYIRAATLDVFDGDSWKLSSRPVPPAHRVGADVELPWPPGLDPSAEIELRNYSFELTDSYGWTSLPLPYPTRVVDTDGDFRYDAETLDVVDADENPRGAIYRTISLDYERTPELLREAPRAGSDLADMIELPDNIPDELDDYIEEAIGELTNPFDQAAAIQSWFRNSGGFSYNIQVPQSGTATSDLINFLEVREGFCQQYAFTMAVMARSLDIPARVAVGFTPGERLDDGSWVVGLHDAHAWPELYFEGIGWVPWEPTPSIRTGTPPPWTQPPQDSDGDADEPTTPDDVTSAPNGDLPEDFLDNEFGLIGGGGASGTPSPWPTILAVTFGIGLLACVPRSIAWTRRQLRWRGTDTDPAAAAEAAWADLREAVSDAALRWSHAATPRRIARHIVTETTLDDSDSELLDHLVISVERARYAPAPTVHAGLKDDTTRLRRALLRSRPKLRQARAWLWPTAVHDLLVGLSNGIVDGMERLDIAGQRLRGRVTRALPTRSE